jgi:hypothetical protein
VIARGLVSATLFLLAGKFPPGKEADLHLVLSLVKETIKIRVCWKEKMIQNTTFPFKAFPAFHFSASANRSEIDFSVSF